MIPRLVPGPRLCGLVAAAVLALLPLLANPYFLFLANELCINALLALGLNILVGYCGQLAFAQAALWGIGAYGAGLLRVRLGLPFAVAIPCGVLLATAIGLAMALPALRLSGHYLALATLAFAQFTSWVFLHWDAVTFGGGGFRVPAPPALVSYYVAFAVIVVATGLASRIVRSRVGRAMIAVRDGEVAAESLGINLLAVKATAFGLSAVCAGLAGGLQVLMLGFVAPETFDLPQMVLQQAMIVCGGLGSVAGSLIGALLLLGLQEGLRAFQGAQEIAFGGLLLAVVVFAPKGLTGTLRRVAPGWREAYIK